MAIEEVIGKCIHKVMSEDENSTTFQDVKKGNKLYDCIDCLGRPYSCPNYRSHSELLAKQYHKLKLDTL